tara:strand:- start:416 stop:688 length:273 start_codon:yes stop_codon:yes gene_type:complete
MTSSYPKYVTKIVLSDPPARMNFTLSMLLNTSSTLEGFRRWPVEAVGVPHRTRIASAPFVTRADSAPVGTEANGTAVLDTTNSSSPFNTP